jgi:Glycosyl hydrolases family 2, sugar binding domain/Glycosyl hydrolases family 2/Glycosyl hydrolases family 2, TIM barrel domain
MRRTMSRILLLPLAAALLLASLAAAKAVSLDGNWIFVPDPAGAMRVSDLASANGIPIRVPSSWQAAYVDRRDYAGVGWYWRTVTLEAPAPGPLLFLRFGAVDYRAEVYVNGQKAGVHDGGYLPFEFDITSLVRAGENQIAVRVVDASARLKEVEGIRYAEVPHGKQNWYVETSGLWQSVELDIRPQSYLDTTHVTADALGNFKIRIPVLNPPATGESGPHLTLGAEMLDAAGEIVWQGRHELNLNEGFYEFSGKLSSPDLWSTSHPALYSLRIKLSSGDEQTVRFGFRTFEARGGKFYLNGQPIYLRGALDQAFYPKTVYTPPSLDELRQEMREAKSLGLNLLRCHIKVPDPRYLEAADEEGVLVWYEIPNWDKLTADSESRALETLRGMAERDWNHPSIIIVSLVNESWGVDLKSPGDRQWLKYAYQQAKKIVPGWLVDDNSACCDNFHLTTDIADFHQYNAIPDHAGDFDRLVGDFATRPRWLFSPYGDAAPKGGEPLMLSEFGNWGLPRLHHPQPWWFTREYKEKEITLPEGVEKRFADYGFGSLFPDFDALAEATQQAQYRALHYEIASLRRHTEIQGYVITEFTDINWESNGLLDFWRQPKVYGDTFHKIQQDDLVVVRADQRNFTAGDRAAAQVYFSYYSGDSLAGAKVAWEVEGTELAGSFDLPAVAPATSAKVGEIHFAAPAVTAPAHDVLKVRVTSGNKTLSEDSLSFYFYASKTLELPPPVSFHDPEGRLRRLVNEMHERGYQAPSGRESFPVLISSAWDAETQRALRDGGIVILVASDAMTLAPGLEVVPRSEDDLSGNWISSFLWIRKDHAPFKSVGFATLPGFEMQAVTPNVVLKGVPPEHFDDVLSGFFYGRIRPNVATLAQANYGKGKLLISTFAVATTYGTDPYATYLLDALMNYAVSGFTPRYRIPL